MGKFLKRNEAPSSRDAAQTASKKKTQMTSLKDLSAIVKTFKELNIDLDFDDLVVTQITCKTCKLFALANMTSNFITGDST